MSIRRHDLDLPPLPGAPLGFKLFFALVLVLALASICLTAWAMLSLASDPAAFGRFLGRVVAGYHEVSK